MEVRRSRIQASAETVWSFASKDSEELARNIREAWKRPVRHNRQIERAALWHGAMLVSACAAAVDDERSDVLSPTGADVETRYELQSGLRFMRHALPFTDGELAQLGLAANQIGSKREFDRDPADRRASDLLARWHDWLWPVGTEGRSPTSDDFGQAAVLVEGAERLAAVTRQILRPDGV